MIDTLYIKRVNYNYFFFQDNKFTKLLYSFSRTHKWFKETRAVFADHNQLEIFTIIKKYKFLSFVDDHIGLVYKNNSYKINNISLSDWHWDIELTNETIDIYKTKTAKYSIFKNGTQIAGVIKGSVEYFDKSIYVFKTDEPETIFFQLSLFLSSIFFKSNDDASISFEVNSPFYIDPDKEWFSSRFDATHFNALKN